MAFLTGLGVENSMDEASHISRRRLVVLQDRRAHLGCQPVNAGGGVRGGDAHVVASEEGTET